MSGVEATGGLKRRIFRNLRWLAGGNIVGAGLSMLAVVVNSRALGLSDFGTFVLLQSSGMLLAGIFTFSSQQPVIKLGVAALNSGQRERFERLVGLGLVADVIGALLAGLTGMIIVLLFSDYLELPPDRSAVAMIVAGSLLLQGYKTSEGILRTFDRFDLVSMTQVGVAALQLVVSVALWVFEAPFALYAALAAGVIALPSMVQLAVAMTILRKSHYKPRFDEVLQASEDRREFVAYCWTTGATGTCDTIRNNGDSTLVGFFVSVEAAGIYNVAKQLAGTLRKTTVIYASVLFPELATMAANRQYGLAWRMLKRATLASLGLTGVAAVGAGLLGWIALRIVFGPAFEAGYPALIVLCAAAGLQILGATYSMYVQAFIGPVALLRAYVVSTAAFLIIILPGLPLIGMEAAAFAQIGFALGLTGACAVQLRRWRSSEEAAQ